MPTFVLILRVISSSGMRRQISGSYPIRLILLDIHQISMQPTTAMKGEAKEVTDEGVRERIAEAELWKEYLMKFMDDRIATLRSALGDGNTETLDDSQRILESLGWKASKKDPRFSWVWNTDRQGAQLPETDRAARLVEAAKNHRLEVGRYVYDLSVDRKFLGRRKVR